MKDGSWSGAGGIRTAGHFNNLYASRPDVVRRQAAEQIYSDRDGYVIRHEAKGGWQQRAGDRWKPVDGRSLPTIRNLDRQEQSLQRGQMRLQNFQQQRGDGFPRGAAGRPGKQ